MYFNVKRDPLLSNATGGTELQLKHGSVTRKSLNVDSCRPH